MAGAVGFSTKLTTTIIHRNPSATPNHVLSLDEIAYYGFPHKKLSDDIFAWRYKNLPHLIRGARQVLEARRIGIAHMYGSLSLALIDPAGKITDFGLASMRIVTAVGLTYVIDCWRGVQTLSNMRYHGFGIGSAVESSADTALATELSTQYETNNTRPTGTLEFGLNSSGVQLTNVFRTVGTLTPDTSVTLSEHGLFSSASAGEGVLFDRSTFSFQNVIVGFALAAQLDITLSGS